MKQFLKYLDRPFWLVFLFVLMLAAPLINSATFNVYSARDYYRAIDLFKGLLVWHGPELQNGGVSTGPFFYYLVAFPSWLAGVKGYLAWMVFLFSFSVALMWSYVRHILSIHAGTVGLIFFLTSHVIISNLSGAMNPSFLYFFWILLAIIVHQIATEKVNLSFKWFLFCSLVGLSAQIHISTFAWVFVCLMFLPIAILRWPRIIGGLLWIIVLQLPYFISTTWQNNPSFEFNLAEKSTSDVSSFVFYLLDVFSIYPEKLKVLDYLKEFTARIGLESFLFLFCFVAVLVLKIGKSKFFDFLKLSLQDKFVWKMGLIIVLVLLFSSGQTININRSFTHYLLGLVFAIISLILWLCKKISLDKSTTAKFFGFFAFSISILFAVRQPSSSHLYWLFPLVIGINVMVHFGVFVQNSIYLLMIIVGFSSTQFSFSKADTNFKISRETSQQIADIILQNTGWSPSEFKLRFLHHLVNHNINFEVYYDESMAKNLDIKRIESIDGYILMSARTFKKKNLDELQTYWSQAIKQGRIEIVKQVKVSRYMLLAYHRKDATFPVHLQNTGEFYPRKGYDFLTFSQDFDQFQVVTFAGRGPTLNIYLSENRNRLFVHSEYTAIDLNVGHEMLIESPGITFYCDQNLRTLKLPNLGHFREESDFYSHKYVASQSIFTPISVDIASCSSFRLDSFFAENLALKLKQRKQSRRVQFFSETPFVFRFK